MKEYLFRSTQRVPRPLAEVFAFFSDARNLEKITPEFLNFQVVEAPKKIESGCLIRYKLSLHGIPLRWTTQILDWNPPHQFVDTQLSGPYKLWHHTHTFRADGDETVMEDVVRYALPFDPFSRIVHALYVKQDVERIFGYRTKVIAELFKAKPGSSVPEAHPASR
jgi:ligand-binding SRPBCC domain-containing protein